MCAFIVADKNKKKYKVFPLQFEVDVEESLFLENLIFTCERIQKDLEEYENKFDSFKFVVLKKDLSVVDVEFSNNKNGDGETEYHIVLKRSKVNLPSI